MKIEELYKHLTPKQLRRIVMYKDGIKVADIARIEAVGHNRIKKSLSLATKKLAKLAKTGGSGVL